MKQHFEKENTVENTQKLKNESGIKIIKEKYTRKIPSFISKKRGKEFKRKTFVSFMIFK